MVARSLPLPGCMRFCGLVNRQIRQAAVPCRLRLRAQSSRQGLATREVRAMVVAVKDPKVAALQATRSLNPHPEKVTDPVFLACGFCDPRDLVQVKYEMVRRVRVDRVAVARAAAEFGYSRQAYYQAAYALDAGGPAALAAGKPGPKGPRKLTEPVMARIDQVLAAEPDTDSKVLAALVAREFGFTVHRRSVERALARRREAPKTGA